MKKIFMYFGDVLLSYSMKNGWEFTLEARNVFNQKTYAYTSYSNLIVHGMS